MSDSTDVVESIAVPSIQVAEPEPAVTVPVIEPQRVLDPEEEKRRRIEAEYKL